MSSKEALDFGLVDEIIQKRSNNGTNNS
jgi:ATP-dependent protease ClpP protease subunit